jgi:hypothetical protein
MTGPRVGCRLSSLRSPQYRRLLNTSRASAATGPCRLATAMQQDVGESPRSTSLSVTVASVASTIGLAHRSRRHMS